MALSIRDAEDAYLTGKAQVEEWVEEFEAGWYGPLGMGLLGAALAALTPDQVMMLAALDPQSADLATQLQGGLSDGHQVQG